MQSHIVGVILALFSAIAWSGSDFSGGYASRRYDPFQVLVLGAIVSVVVLFGMMFITHEPFPSQRSLIISTIAGGLGVIGLASLYLGLSLSSSALVSPVAGVIGAGIPVLLGILQQGMPTWLQLTGFFLAFIGIWQVTQSSQSSKGDFKMGLKLSVLAGFCFGGFLSLMSLIVANEIYGSLAVEKMSSFFIALFILWRRRLPVPNPLKAPVAVLSGLIDAVGNSLFLLAAQFTRLDVAAIISNLYPAGTVLLTRMILGERVSKQQWVGVTICLGAIILVTS